MGLVLHTREMVGANGACGHLQPASLRGTAPAQPWKNPKPPFSEDLGALSPAPQRQRGRESGDSCPKGFRNPAPLCYSSREVRHAVGDVSWKEQSKVAEHFQLGMGLFKKLLSDDKALMNPSAL